MKRETEIKLLKLHNITIGVYAVIWFLFLFIGVYFIGLYTPMYFNLIAIIIFIIFWFFVVFYLDRIEMKSSDLRGNKQ